MLDAGVVCCLILERLCGIGRFAVLRSFISLFELKNSGGLPREEADSGHVGI